MTTATTTTTTATTTATTLADAMRETGERLLRLAADVAFNDAVARAGAALVLSLAARGRVFSCGNGGSMCDAMHFAEELTGRFRDNRAPIAATAISDASHLSCVANDFGFDQVYSRYVQAHGRAGDVLIALSTSGTSRNIIAAAEAMKALGGTVIALTGRPDSPLGALADVDICVGTQGYADRAQEVHIVVLHSLCQIIEAGLSLPTTPK